MRYIEKALERVSICLLILLTAVVTLQVVTRFLNHPFVWTEEMARYSLVYFSFLGGALAYYKGEGLRITFLIDKFPPRMRKLNDLVILIMSLVILVVIVCGSLLFAVEIWDTPTTALQWNKGLVFVVVPIGFALIFFKFLNNLKKNIGSQ